MTITPKNKLIRDIVIESISSEGRTPNIKILDQSSFEKEIFTKLIDESKEVMESKDDPSHLPEELADVLEVIDCIIKTKNLNLEEIQKIKHDKKSQWGSFDKRIWLESVTEKD